MSNAAHRNTDSRACGASTVTAQSKNVYVNGLLWSINGDPNSHGDGNLSAATKNVYVNGLLWSINGDPNSHGDGNLSAATKNVFIGGVAVVNVGDSASADGLCVPLGGSHCAPSATGGSSDVFVGD